MNIIFKAIQVILTLIWVDFLGVRFEGGGGGGWKVKLLSLSKTF